MAQNGWTWLEITGIAGHNWKFMEMAGYVWTWLEMAGYG